MPSEKSWVSRSSLPRNPSLRFERAAWKSGYEVVAGADEVGRGAWAGPLVAAAVALPRETGIRSKLTRSLNRANLQPRDSKLVSPQHRAQIVQVLRALAIPTGICELWPVEIDEVGMGCANRMVLARAIEALPSVDFALVDAFRVDDLACDAQAIVGGDRRCLSIALASIVAKVHRDEIMRRLDDVYPGYGFGQHKGYGTRMHAEALAALGVCDVHRMSFRPVAVCRVGL